MTVVGGTWTVRPTRRCEGCSVFCEYLAFLADGRHLCGPCALRADAQATAPVPREELTSGDDAHAA